MTEEPRVEEQGMVVQREAQPTPGSQPSLRAVPAAAGGDGGAGGGACSLLAFI